MVGNQCEIHWLFLEPYSRSAAQYSPLLNDGQEKSSSTILISIGIKLDNFIYFFMKFNKVAIV